MNTDEIERIKVVYPEGSALPGATLIRSLCDELLKLKTAEADVATLQDEYEELSQRYEEQRSYSLNTKTLLNRSVGYFTPSSTELAAVVAHAVKIAREKDPEFEKKYVECRAESLAGALESMRLFQRYKKIAASIADTGAQVDRLKKRAEEHPGVFDEELRAVQAQLEKLRTELLEMAGTA